MLSREKEKEKIGGWHKKTCYSWMEDGGSSRVQIAGISWWMLDLRSRAGEMKCDVAEKERRSARADRLIYELALEWLYGLYVLCLPALRSLDNGELNGLTFLQAAESACLDGRVMDENVFAVLTANEAVALRVIEPLNCSLFHGDACSFKLM